MIFYTKQNQRVPFRLLCHLSGSVFPFSFCVAIPPAIISVTLKYFQTSREEDMIDEFSANRIVHESEAFNRFTLLVGFFVVFRTTQAYSRFWEGFSTTQNLRGELVDAACSVTAFCKAATANAETVGRFKHIMVRLFSILHSMCLASITDTSRGEVDIYKFRLIDIQGIDRRSLKALRDTNKKVELVFQWIQKLMVHHTRTGVLCIAPPILSRSFQQMARCMVNFEDAQKIAQTPFPFPYAQTTTTLLLVHWFMTPIVITAWVDSATSAGCFCFVQVFILWALNTIAEEIEQPFGVDSNDLDAEFMQEEMNRHLSLLVTTEGIRTPKLSTRAVLDPQRLKYEDGWVCPFREVWKKLNLDRQAVRVSDKSKESAFEKSEPRGKTAQHRRQEFMAKPAEVGWSLNPDTGSDSNTGVRSLTFDELRNSESASSSNRSSGEQEITSLDQMLASVPSEKIAEVRSHALRLLRANHVDEEKLHKMKLEVGV